MDSQSDFRVPEDEEPLATAEQLPLPGRRDIDLLRQAVMDEKVAPELLHYETDLIARVEQMLDYQVRPTECSGGGTHPCVKALSFTIASTPSRQQSNVIDKAGLAGTHARLVRRRSK